MAEETHWYRYYEQAMSGGGVKVYLSCYPVIRTTPKGVWIDIYGGRERFVLREARKQFACPTLEAARESYLARKMRHLTILNAQARGVRRAMEHFEDMGRRGDNEDQSLAWAASTARAQRAAA